MKSAGDVAGAPGLHVAIIMDGNGRWAQARGRARSIGHRAGARAVRQVVETAPTLGITTLTLYAFSGDNWQRPSPEVHALLRLLQVYLHSEISTCIKNRVRLQVIGRREDLPRSLQASMAAAEAATASGDLLRLRLAVNYSARRSILEAAGRFDAQRDGSYAGFARLLGEAYNEGSPVPDVDLLLRTGGEQRLSDFLLWECAYAELAFIDRLWPDFTPADLATAVQDFQRRDRRFGGLAVAAAR